MTDTLDSLSAELTAYCEAHKLPPMSADELACEIWAAVSDGTSSYVAPPMTAERRTELDEARTWLRDFGERWSALENEDDRFEIWRATGQDVADLRDHSDVTQLYPDVHPEALPGRLYDPGHMARLPDGGFEVIVGNGDWIFDSLAAAESLLWSAYARAEIEAR